MFYITGDTHGNFKPIKCFCAFNNLTKDDVLVVLGDAGVNYFLNERDLQAKKLVAKIPATIFCIHGNHEARPHSLPHLYREIEWRGGIAYVEDAYPNLLFAKDGEVYDFDGISAIVIGGAYSVDKHYRLMHGWSWFADEQPDEETKARVEAKLDSLGWEIDAVLTHTCPTSFEPIEAYIDGIDQSTVDKSTELWLDEIEKKLNYRKWYCGHWHIEKRVGKLQFMFGNIEPFELD